MLDHPPDWRLRARYGGLLAAFWAGGYFTVQAHATVAFDSTLPVDTLVPFVSAAVWLYLAGLGWIVSPLFLLRSRAELRLAARSYAFALALALLCFYLFQARAPGLRAEVQLLANQQDWSMAALALLHAVDGPGNLVPSLHVGLSWLAADALTRGNARWRLPSLSIALAVTLSVLLCKQHTVLDVLAGLLLAALCRAEGPYRELLAGRAPTQPRSHR